MATVIVAQDHLDDDPQFDEWTDWYCWSLKFEEEFDDGSGADSAYSQISDRTSDRRSHIIQQVTGAAAHADPERYNRAISAAIVYDARLLQLFKKEDLAMGRLQIRLRDEERAKIAA